MLIILSLFWLQAVWKFQNPKFYAERLTENYATLLKYLSHKISLLTGRELEYFIPLNIATTLLLKFNVLLTLFAGSLELVTPAVIVSTGADEKLYVAIQIWILILFTPFFYLDGERLSQMLQFKIEENSGSELERRAVWLEGIAWAGIFVYLWCLLCCRRKGRVWINK